jgi:hypothetical protein
MGTKDENRQYGAAFGLDETSGACRSSEERIQRKERRVGYGWRKEESVVIVSSMFVHCNPSETNTAV